METDVLKHFIGKDVEVLVSGIWLEGHMQPIAKGIVTLTPVGEMGIFYGPTACKTEVIQAIRQVKKSGESVADPVSQISQPPTFRSSLESVTPGQRFKGNK
jgi:hypothetical protein